MTVRLLDYEDAAAYLGCTEAHLRRMTYERRIPFVKFGDGRSAPVRFDIRDLDRWIEARKVPARSAS